MKDGDIDQEFLVFFQIEHGISAVHLAHLCFEVTATDVLVSVTGIDLRLYAYNAIAFDLPSGSIAIEYMPMPAEELHRECIVVFNGDPVGEHVFSIHRIGIIRLIEAFHGHLHTLRHFRYHRRDGFDNKNTKLQTHQTLFCFICSSNDHLGLFLPCWRKINNSEIDNA